MFTLTPTANQIDIGTGTYYNDKTVKFVVWYPEDRISIGKFCSIADHVTIISGGEHRTETVSTWPFTFFMFPELAQTMPTNRRTPPTTVENDVWIGYGAQISGGARIGSGAVIGAGSVVRSDVPPYAIVAGNPARIMRYRFSRDAIKALLRICWWDWPEDRIRANVEWFHRPVQDFIDEFGVAE